MALMDTIRLNPTGSGIDPAVWNISTHVLDGDRGGLIVSAGTTNYDNITSVAQYNLTGSYAYIGVTSIRYPLSATKTVYPLRLNLDGNNAIYWAITDEKIKVYKVVAGVTTQLTTATYDRTVHKAVKIRESGGTVYFDYSSDFSSWTNFASATVASLFAVTSLYLQIGTQATIAETPDNIFFDPLNITYPAIATFTDNFNDNSLDTTKWDYRSDPNVTITETNQRLEFAFPVGTVIGESSYVENKSTTNVYSLDNSSLKIKIVQAPLSSQPGGGSVYIQNHKNNDYAIITVTQGNILIDYFDTQPPYSVPVNLVTFPYNATLHKWWRIRGNGSSIYFDTSSDGIEWLNKASTPVNPSFANIVMGILAYADGSVTNGGKFIVDYLNVAEFVPIITLTGNGVITSAPHTTYHMSITMTGGATISAVGVSLADQSAIEKTYLYKVYDTSNNFIGIWNDVISEFTYDQEINSAGSSIQVDLARNSDSRVIGLQTLVTSNTSENITTQDSNNIVMANETNNAIGPGTNVDVNLRVEVWVFYGEITELSTTAGDIITTSGDEPLLVNFGAVNGLRRFNGYITRYVSRYGGNETVQVSISSFGVELDNYVYESGTSTTVTRTLVDPSNMLTTALSAFNVAGGRVSYTSSSIASTGTSATYTFRMNTYLEVIRKCLELAPYDWYWYVGLGDDTVYFNAKPLTLSHYFILGKHVKELNLEYSIEDITNVVYFTGGEVTPEVNLFKKYTDATSITNYRRGLQRISDHRVTLDASATLISEAEIDRNSTPRYRSSITLLDSAFEIESVQLGQLIGFRNFGNYIDDLELQVVGLRYEPHQVTLQLDTLLPSVNKRIEELRRNLVELDNEQTPATPS